MFLLGNTLVARCDLKADRQRKVLIVQSAFLESGQDARRVVAALAGELRHMQGWLELEGIEVAERGDLAANLRRAFAASRLPSKAHGSPSRTRPGSRPSGRD